MADATTTTPSGALKGTTAFTHTPVSNRFVQLLDALARATEAERDIERGGSRDLAFADLLRESELLWQRATGEAVAICDSPARRASDRVLIRAAQVLHYALGCEHPAEYDAAVIDLAACGDGLPHGAANATSWRLRQMLHTAEVRLAEIGRLEMISRAPDPDNFDDWLPLAC